MKVFKSYGSKERLFEMMMNVNKGLIKEGFDTAPAQSPTPNQLQFKKNFKYWDVTKYPYGGDFKAFDGTESGQLVKGNVKRGDEIRVQLADGRVIVAPAQAVANMDFDSVLDLAKSIGREIVEDFNFNDAERDFYGQQDMAADQQQHPEDWDNTPPTTHPHSEVKPIQGNN